MYRSWVDRDSFFGADVRTVLQIFVLTLLLSLEVETSETAYVFLDHRTTANTLVRVDLVCWRREQ